MRLLSGVGSDKDGCYPVALNHSSARPTLVSVSATLDRPEVAVVRHPIADAKNSVVGYELRFGGAVDLGVGVRRAQRAQRAQLGRHHRRVERLAFQPRIGRHVRLGHQISRVVQMHALPLVAVLAAHPVQVGAGALAAPLERAVVDKLAGGRIRPVAQRLGQQRAHHLRVTVVAALAHVDVAPGELQCGVGLEPRHRLGRAPLEEQRHDLNQTADRDHEHDQHDHQQIVGLDVLVREGLDRGVELGGGVCHSALLRRGPLRAECGPARRGRCSPSSPRSTP
jgi:hypothetical protein